jgi:predicted DNA-binding ribbon-helix-helix protein
MIPEYEKRLDSLFFSAFDTDSKPMKDYASMKMETKSLRSALAEKERQLKISEDIRAAEKKILIQEIEKNAEKEKELAARIKIDEQLLITIKELKDERSELKKECEILSIALRLACTRFLQEFYDRPSKMSVDNAMESMLDKAKQALEGGEK